MGRPRSALRVRSAAAALTLAAHLLFGLLLVIGDWRGSRPEPLAREPEGVWITLTSLLPPPLPDSSLPPVPERERPVAPAPAAPPRPASTAITLPAQESAPDQPAITPSDRAPAPAVDWMAESSKLAARFAEEQDRPKTFSPPPAVMRQPCKPRDSSFEWKSDQKSSGSGALTLGWEPPPPNKHLFDDMKAGKTPRSSVPDPETCD